MSNLKTVNQIIKDEVTRLGLGATFKISPSKIVATHYEDLHIGPETLQVPMLGGLTELESLLYRWITKQRQNHATKLHLAELQLAESMVRDLDVPDHEVSGAIATCLKWVAGEHSGSYKFVRWLVDHCDDVQSVIDLSGGFTWDYCRLLGAACFLGCRIDPDRDWTEEFLLSNTLLSDVESLVAQEMGELEDYSETLDEVAEGVADRGLGE